MSNLHIPDMNTMKNFGIAANLFICCVFNFVKVENKLKCTVMSGICSYSIHRTVNKVNFPMYKYLKHYRKTVLPFSLCS